MKAYAKRVHKITKYVSAQTLILVIVIAVNFSVLLVITRFREEVYTRYDARMNSTSLPYLFQAFRSFKYIQKLSLLVQTKSCSFTCLGGFLTRTWLRNLCAWPDIWCAAEERRLARAARGHRAVLWWVVCVPLFVNIHSIRLKNGSEKYWKSFGVVRVHACEYIKFIYM